MIKPVLTKEELIQRVEFFVHKDNLTYMESLIHICNDLDIDPEDIAKIISPPLKEKIMAEAQRMSTISSSSRTVSLYEN
jgi:hypothetical protein